MQGDLRQSQRSSRHRRQVRAQQVQNRRFVLAVCLLSIVVVVTAVASYSSRAEAAPDSVKPGTGNPPSASVDPAADLVSATYTAELIGSSSDPTYARGVFTLEFDADTDVISYSLEITSPLANPSTATISQGAPGQNGLSLFTIFPGPPIAGNFSGMLAQGRLTASDLTGPLQGRRLADLILLIKNGGIYVTVGTTNVPTDAIRGQVK